VKGGSWRNSSFFEGNGTENLGHSVSSMNRCRAEFAEIRRRTRRPSRASHAGQRGSQAWLRGPHTRLRGTYTGVRGTYTGERKAPVCRRNQLKTAIFADSPRPMSSIWLICDSPVKIDQCFSAGNRRPWSLSPVAGRKKLPRQDAPLSSFRGIAQNAPRGNFRQLSRSTRFVTDASPFVVPPGHGRNLGPLADSARPSRDRVPSCKQAEVLRLVSSFLVGGCGLFIKISRDCKTEPV
jgi:hypothetical protein